jgi:DNA primase
MRQDKSITQPKLGQVADDRREIDEVLARTDIVALIEQYVTLKRSGPSLTGLCPFHSERTPSFHVKPEIGRWHCFGQCSEGGDAIKFIQKMDNLTFPEALERLALRAGVTLTRRLGSREGGAPGETSERERIYRINMLALRYYREQLGQSSAAQDYLRRRKIGADVQQAFGLGFAPEQWDGLTAYFASRGVSPADAERAGLLSQSERGHYYDKLRSRIVFPIFDVEDRVIAFGGRLIEDAPGQPKYWNSPETPVFSKSRSLYGLSRARKAIGARGHALVVEGYTDVIAAHQAGFENTVATLGTALTEEHVKKLARLAPFVLLAFDADSAGLKAAYRAAEIFAGQGVDVKVLDLPEGEDPDSLLRAGRKGDFERAIKEPLALAEFQLRRLIRRGPVETEDDRLALLSKARAIVASVPSVIERDRYIKMLARYHPRFTPESQASSGIVLAEEQLRREVSRLQSGMTTGYSARRDAGADTARTDAQQGRSAVEKAERDLLLALVGERADLAELVVGGIAPEEFYTEDGRSVAAELYRLGGGRPDRATRSLVAEISSDRLRSFIGEIILEPPRPITERLIETEIARLRDYRKRQQLTDIKAQILRGDLDTDTYRQLVPQLQSLQSEVSR